MNVYNLAIGFLSEWCRSHRLPRSYAIDRHVTHGCVTTNRRDHKHNAQAWYACTHSLPACIHQLSRTAMLLCRRTLCMQRSQSGPRPQRTPEATPRHTERVARSCAPGQRDGVSIVRHALVTHRAPLSRAGCRRPLHSVVPCQGGTPPRQPRCVQLRDEGSPGHRRPRLRARRRRTFHPECKIAHLPHARPHRFRVPRVVHRVVVAVGDKPVRVGVGEEGPEIRRKEGGRCSRIIIGGSSPQNPSFSARW